MTKYRRAFDRYSKDRQARIVAAISEALRALGADDAQIACIDADGWAELWDAFGEWVDLAEESGGEPQ